MRVKKDEESLWLAAIWFNLFVGMNIEFKEAQLLAPLRKEWVPCLVINKLKLFQSNF